MEANHVNELQLQDDEQNKKLETFFKGNLAKEKKLKETPSNKSKDFLPESCKTSLSDFKPHFSLNDEIVPKTAPNVTNKEHVCSVEPTTPINPSVCNAFVEASTTYCSVSSSSPASTTTCLVSTLPTSSKGTSNSKEINFYLQKLKEMVPYAKSAPKLSKVQLIHCAIDYITDLQEALEARVKRKCIQQGLHSLRAPLADLSTSQQNNSSNASLEDTGNELPSAPQPNEFESNRVYEDNSAAQSFSNSGQSSSDKLFRRSNNESIGVEEKYKQPRTIFEDTKEYTSISPINNSFVAMCSSPNKEEGKSLTLAKLNNFSAIKSSYENSSDDSDLDKNVDIKEKIVKTPKDLGSNKHKKRKSDDL